MFRFLQLQYQAGKIGVSELDEAVAKGWITEAQKQEIMG